MSLFLSTSDKENFLVFHKGNAFSKAIFWALVNRSEKRASTPGLNNSETTAQWWHCASEYLTDAAMVHKFKPSVTLTAWLRDATLSIARRPIADWVGPPFRDHSTNPACGHLETAHLSWALAIVLDLAPEVFSEQERDELTTTLHEKGIALCQRWLDTHSDLANWRCVLNAGVAVAAAVINDKEAIESAVREFNLCLDAFQPDGSYAESLQYGNYAAYALMLAREALTRRDPSLEARLPLAPYVHKPRWDAASLLYLKPLTGWGAYPRPRSANFNDSSAMYRASGDLLLHIAARGKSAYPKDAGLARWLFDTLYLPCFEQPPHDLASFGFINDFGFLSIPLLPQAAAALSPQAAGIGHVSRFSCGDILIRDNWESDGGTTTLSIRGAGDPLHAPGHLHGDLNSFILTHNKERLLADPGHSCYRNLIRDLEVSSFSHNTCTFVLSEAGNGSAQEAAKASALIQQTHTCKRLILPSCNLPEPPAHRGGTFRLAARQDDVSVAVSEVAALYGDPISEFTRIWMLCGSHALFVIDRIRSKTPVLTHWNWLLNNRDGQLDLKLVQPDRIVVRRGNAGMKIFHTAKAHLQQPQHAYIHDAYHPLPAQQGEGKSGSGQLIRWAETMPATERLAVHAICVDSPGMIADWHLRQTEGDIGLESPGATLLWQLHTGADKQTFTLRETVSNRNYTLSDHNGQWQLRSEK